MIEDYERPGFGYQVAKSPCTECFADAPYDFTPIPGAQFKCYDCENVLTAVSLKEESSSPLDRFDRDTGFRDMVRGFELKGLIFDRRYFVPETVSVWLNEKGVDPIAFNNVEQTRSWIVIDNGGSLNSEIVTFVDKDGVFGMYEKVSNPVHLDN